jgi:hypothetical protein
MSMIDLQRFMEFTEAREANSTMQEPIIKWEDPEMQRCIVTARPCCGGRSVARSAKDEEMTHDSR